MERRMSSPSGWGIAVAGLTSMLAACSDNTTTSVAAREYLETRLVADTAGLGAASVDTSLKNPWGMAFGPTGVLWVSDNHAGASTLYDTTGAKRALVVAIPASGSATGGAPSGIVYNPTTDFVIPGAPRLCSSSPARMGARAHGVRRVQSRSAARQLRGWPNRRV